MVYGLEHQVDPAENEHSLQVPCCRIRERGEPHDQRREGHQQAPGNDSADNGQPGEPSAVFFRKSEVSGSKDVPDHDPGAVSETSCHTGDKASGDSGDRVGCHGITAHVAHDHAVKRIGDSPDESRRKKRSRVFPVVFCQFRLRSKQPVPVYVHDDVFTAVIRQDHRRLFADFEHAPDELHGSCQDSREGSSHDAEFRGAEKAEDQDRIHNDIQRHSKRTDPGSGSRAACRLQRGQIDLGDSAQDIGKSHRTQVGGTAGYKRFLIGKNMHDPAWNKEGSDRERGADDRHIAQIDRDQPLNDQVISLAPVLGGEDTETSCDSQDKQVQDKLDLAAEGNSRQGCLVYQAQHNGVRRTDQCQHKGLDDHRQYE